MDRDPQGWRRALEAHERDPYTHGQMIEQAAKGYADQIKSNTEWRKGTDVRLNRLEMFQQRLIGAVLLMGAILGGGGLVGIFELIKQGGKLF